MYSLAKKSKLGRFTKQRISLLRNLTLSTFKHGYIFTTKERALAVKSLVDKIINKAKKMDLNNDRKIISFFFQNKDSLKEVKKYLTYTNVQNKNSGYTSVVKTDYRKGDKALMCCISILI